MSERRLNQMELEFEAANVRIGEATWNSYSGEGDADLDGAQRQLAQLLANSANRSLVEEWAAEVDADRNPALARRLKIWKNCFTSSLVDNVPEIFTLKNRLQRRIADYRFELDGRELPRSELIKILRREPDREKRRRAWRATLPLAAANRADLQRLIDLRNQKAHELGYRDYVSMLFELQDVDENWLLQTLNRLEEKTKPLYARLVAQLADCAGVTHLAPWDVSYAMRKGFQLDDRYFPADQALERLHTTARSLGFDVASLPIRTLVKDIPFGGYNVAVKIPEDTRFLVNPSEGQSFYTTTFHEFGHSLQAVFTATPWPILKEYEWVLGAHAPCYSEGMAEVMGDFARRRDWLSSVARVPEAEAEIYATRLLPAQMLVRQFDLLLNLRIELAAYASDSRNLAEVERELTAEVRLLECPSEEAPQWEANTWYTSYPVYWQNYILASIIASQVHERLEREFGETLVTNSAVKEHLTSYFYSSGNAIPWAERIRNGTGIPLGLEAYLRRIQGIR